MNIFTLKHERQWDQRGVTLVELLVTMGLLSVFMLILLTIFTSSIDVGSRSASFTATSTDSRLILTRLAYDIRRASTISTPASLGDTSPSLTLTIDSSTYIYAVNGGKLQLTVDGTTDDLTGDEATISGLNFQELGNSGGRESIRYSFAVTASSQASHEPDTQTFTSTTERRL